MSPTSFVRRSLVPAVCIAISAVILFAPLASAEEPAKPKWTSLFDGKKLGDWKSIDFGGEGEVSVKDGMIVMPTGNDLTGIVYKGKIPRDNYELSLEGQRLNGSDFFATTTFPVGKEYCSFVTGGWGGTLIGLSCVDFYDASDNLTTQFVTFKDKVWYKFLIRVSTSRIEVYIDGKLLVNQKREGHKFDLRFEVDPCRPLGVCSWQTTGAVRNIKIRELTKEEIAAAAKRTDPVPYQ